MAVLREFVAYYNQERPHRILGLQTPEPTLRPVTGVIRWHPILNGLHHVYKRVALTPPQVLPSHSSRRRLNFRTPDIEFNGVIQNLCFRRAATPAIAMALPACGRVRIG